MRPHLCQAERRQLRAGGLLCQLGAVDPPRPAAGEVTGRGTASELHTSLDPFLI